MAKINMHCKVNLKNVKVSVLVQMKGPSGLMLSSAASRSECIGESKTRTKYDKYLSPPVRDEPEVPVLVTWQQLPRDS